MSITTEQQNNLKAAVIEAVRSIYRVPLSKQKEILVISPKNDIGVSISPILIKGRKFKTEFGKITIIGILESLGIPDAIYKDDSALALGERKTEEKEALIRYKSAYHSIMSGTVDEGSEKGLADFQRYHNLVMTKVNNIMVSRFDAPIMPVVWK